MTWNRSKRSVSIDIDLPSDSIGRQRLDGLLAEADVLVHSFGPTRSKQLGLDDESLANRHPHLIAVSILGGRSANPTPSDRLTTC